VGWPALDLWRDWVNGGKSQRAPSRWPSVELCSTIVKS